MKQARSATWTRSALIGITLFLVAQAALAEDEQRTRIRKTQERIKRNIAECVSAEREGDMPPVEALRADFESLATEVEGLKALAKYQDHQVDYVALLAVRAIAGAPKELQLGAGRILASHARPQCLKEGREAVFVATVRGLGRSGYLGGVQPLLRTMERTRDPKVCKAIVEALGLLGDPRAVAVLHDRLSSGTSANLRGPEGSSEARKRSPNPRQGTGVDGTRNNAGTNARGEYIETLAADRQPADEKAVVNEIYLTMSKLLGPIFTNWHAVDQYRREHKRELKKAEAEAERKRREQDREVSRLFR